MSAVERRFELIRALCRRRHETIANLAVEFGVSERTIRRDIDGLSTIIPVYIKPGRCGGIFIIEDYTMDRIYMSDDEIKLLKKLRNVIREYSELLDKQDREHLDRIIKTYTKPNGG